MELNVFYAGPPLILPFPSLCLLASAVSSLSAPPNVMWQAIANEFYCSVPACPAKGAASDLTNTMKPYGDWLCCDHVHVYLKEKTSRCRLGLFKIVNGKFWAIFAKVLRLSNESAMTLSVFFISFRPTSGRHTRYWRISFVTRMSLKFIDN